jgi:3-demethylubiquinone-9 3-methyltransferase
MNDSDRLSSIVVGEDNGCDIPERNAGVPARACRAAEARGGPQCGWLKDKYGLSWQIVSIALDKNDEDQDPKRVDRVTQAFLKMKKFDLAALQRAYDGK